MAERTYEYECMRAELLGLEKPDYDEFMRNKLEDARKEVEVEDEDLDTKNLNEADLEKESLTKISGGLDELTNILRKTQSRINRFKTSCGSITNLLKIKNTCEKSGSSSSLNDNSSTASNSQAEPAETEPTEDGTSKEKLDGSKSEDAATPRKSDLAKALDSNISRLDSMIDAAENAQYSMKEQRNQMKKFLK